MTMQLAGVEFDDAHTAATVRINETVYSKPAVLRACYWFARDLHFRLEENAPHLFVTVSLRVASPTLDHPRIKPLDEWLNEFFDALVDSQLRVEIQAETAAVRDLIIAKAFAESGILEDVPPGTFGDPVDSPDIAPKNLIQIGHKQPE
jgi:His-Xaa-Ser system protein HxsD